MTLKKLLKKIKWLLIILLCVKSGIVIAQLDNNSFRENRFIDSSKQVNGVYLKANNLSFTKNNEYFNQIANGRTFFGFQFIPEISYYPSKNVKLSAGGFFWKDFGNPEFSQIAPTFSITLQKNNASLIFGNLKGNLNHKLIQPLYHFEKIISDRLEHGIQGLYKNEFIDLDLWIDWEKALYPGDSAQEQIFSGLSSDLKLLEYKNTTIKVPFQLTVFHKGGQIDVSDAPLVTRTNSALGFSIMQRINGNKWMEGLRMQNYFTLYKDFSPNSIQPFKTGNGYYLNLTWLTEHFNLMFSYWKGKRYISSHGGHLYQSVSNNFRNPEYQVPERELIFMRFLQDIQIMNNLFLTARFEPFYDVKNKNLEFSHGLYINYKPDFLLGKAGNKESMK